MPDDEVVLDEPVVLEQVLGVRTQLTCDWLAGVIGQDVHPLLNSRKHVTNAVQKGDVRRDPCVDPVEQKGQQLVGAHARLLVPGWALRSSSR